MHLGGSILQQTINIRSNATIRQTNLDNMSLVEDDTIEVRFEERTRFVLDFRDSFRRRSSLLDFLRFRIEPFRDGGVVRSDDDVVPFQLAGICRRKRSVKERE